jgi:hypothetical protein
LNRRRRTKAAAARFPYVHNKYICDVLEEMRKCDKSKNYGPLYSLIEQAQIMATAMEDALSLQRDLKQMINAQKTAKRLIKRYKKEIENKKPDVEKIEEILEQMRDL